MSHKKLHFTDEEINEANNINILDYIGSLNLDTKRAGKTIKVEGYGGLYIDPQKNKWNCFSQGKGGGAIQLVMFLENKSWVESIKTLLGNSYESKNMQTFDRDVQKENYKDFILPKKNKTFNHVIAYLIKTRGIDKDVVYKFINNKMLYEDENRNCVFVGYNKEGVPRYANLRSSNTNITFKGEVRNSNKVYSFNLVNENSNKLYVFESPIELMSYMTRIKMLFGKKFEDNAVSLGGLTDLALNQFLKDNLNIKAVHLCLNNDEPGRRAAENIKMKYKSDYKIEIEHPILKDFNEDLTNILRSLENKFKEEFKSKVTEEYDMEM